MRILVVDDEVRLAEGVRRGLEAEGFAVDVAHNGVDGLWRARETRYDAIVLDLMMPGMSGWKVCEALRAEENWTPVLMLTAKDGEWDQVEGLDTGADDYLTKPFHFVVLVARLRALLRRAAAPAQGSQAPAAGATLTVGDLRIVPDQHRCLRGDDEIALTAREFGILAYLARRPGVVVGKAELIDELWDFASPADQNVVEVHISSLRRKVDAPFGRRTIETVRGVGYRLNPDEGE